MFKLHDFQQKLKNDIHNGWQQNENVLAVAPTGSGKTVLFSDIITSADTPTCAIAHRQELIGQMSLSLAKNGIYHRIVGPTPLIKMINQLHVYILGKSFYKTDGHVGVAGINTLVRRKEQLRRWLPEVKLWVLDEAHHLLKNNIWGKGIAMFPNARGLGVTATPCRADGQGLGRHHDGLFDEMVVGPTGRELIQKGFLCDYRIFAPPCDIDFSTVKISNSTGDLVKNQLVKATEQSHIVGDIVGEYLKHAPGKLGVTFLPSVEIASQVSDNFNAHGVPAMVVSAKTPDIERVKILKRFANREILQLVNVDLFGEGFDLPALEVVSMGRKTESYSLFCQQFGRALRTADGKSHAIIIDHVGNVISHASKKGLPDIFSNWTLDRRDRRKSKRDPDLIPVRGCVKCTAIYEAYHKKCPFCGYLWVPESRTTPEQVEGDLEELDPNTLTTLMNEIAKIDKPAEQVKQNLLRSGASDIVAFGAAKQHRIRKAAQAMLRDSIAQWAGWHKAAMREDSEIHKRFFYRFGVDVMTAQTMGRPDAEKLTVQINKSMGI